MRTHYELLGIDPAADVDTIRKAFRREIARYHPDKVIHLGQEFQDIAATRAAQLTTAYNTLTNGSARAEYDASIDGGLPAGRPTSPAPPPPDWSPPPPSVPHAAAQQATAPGTQAPASGRPFQPERTGRDTLVRRAALGRVRQVLTSLAGDCDVATVKGFDFALLTRARRSLFRRSTPPSVLVRLAPVVDAAVAADAWASATAAGLAQKPLVLLLLGDDLAPTGELAQAIDDQRRRNPDLVDAVFPVPVRMQDWSAKVPANAPDSVRSLVESLRTYAG